MTTSPVPSNRRSSPRTVTPSTTGTDATATAATDGNSASNTGLDPADHAIAGQAIGMEIALRDLIRSGSQDDMMQQFAAAHEAFATRIAGIAGIPATTVDEAFQEDHSGAFDKDAVDATEAAESEAAARYVSWMQQISDSRLVAAFSSISVAESRQAALLAMGSGLEAALGTTTGAGS